jgi:hypothetical protein
MRTKKDGKAEKLRKEDGERLLTENAVAGGLDLLKVRHFIPDTCSLFPKFHPLSDNHSLPNTWFI